MCTNIYTALYYCESVFLEAAGICVPAHNVNTEREGNVMRQEWSYSNCKEGNNMHTTSCSNRDTLCMFLLQTCMPQCILVDTRQIAMIFQSRSYEAIPPWNMAV